MVSACARAVELAHLNEGGSAVALRRRVRVLAWFAMAAAFSNNFSNSYRCVPLPSM
jgi:hypothetical protein